VGGVVFQSTRRRAVRDENQVGVERTAGLRSLHKADVEAEDLVM